MLIEKVDDGKEFPKCPDCGIVLCLESSDLSNAQKTEEEQWNNCEHDFPPSDAHGRFRECRKCGFSPHTSHILCARLMRCPKCAALYHVEDG
jgi:uncharacterized C2H2 Zn-finger protein